MKIEAIHIAGYGALHDRRLSFPDGIAVIRDDAPDSIPTDVLIGFIRFVFYGLPAGVSAGDTAGSLTVRRDDGDILKISRDDTGVRVTTGDGAVLSDAAPLIGVSAEAFDAAAVIDDVRDEAAQTRLRRVLFGEGENSAVCTALDRIDSVRRSLIADTGRGGAVYELQKQRAETEAEIARSHEASKRATALAAALARTRESREQAEESLAKLKTLETAYGNLSMIRRYDTLHDLETQEAACRDACRAHRTLRAVDGFYPDKDYLTTLAVCRRQVADAARQYAIAQKNLARLTEEGRMASETAAYISRAREMGGFRKIRQNATVLTRRAARASVAATVLLILTALFAFLGIAMFERNTAFSVTALMLAAASFAASLIRFRFGRQLNSALMLLCRDYGTKLKSDLFSRLQELETETERHVLNEQMRLEAGERAEACRLECARTVRELTTVAKRFGHAVDPDDVGASLDTLERDVRDCLAEETRLIAAYESIHAQVLRHRTEVAGTGEITVRTLVSPLKRQNLQTLESEGRIGEIDRGIQFYTDQINLLDKRIAALEADYRNICAGIGDPAALAVSANTLDTRIAALTLHHRAYTAAGDALSAAEERLGCRAAAVLTAETNRLSEASGISAAPRLTLSVPDSTGGHTVFRPAESADQSVAGFALLAAARTVCAADTLPVIFNHTADRVPSGLTAAVLHGLTDRSGQVILITADATLTGRLRGAGIAVTEVAAC